MPGRWDTGLKRLIAEHPEQFISWVLPGATLSNKLKHKAPNLNNREIEMDGLYEIELDNTPCQVHFEFQSGPDETMAKRMWAYNALGTFTYDKPTCSIVIYLKPCAVPEPTYRWEFPPQQVMHQFFFTIIKLWEISPQSIKQTGMAGLFPLMVLAKGGKSHAVVDETIASIRSSGDAASEDLLSLTYLIASLAFTSHADKTWLKGRFEVMRDILEDTWAYQEILQEGRLEGQRETLLEVVQARFPDLAPVAQQVTNAIDDPDVLQRLVVKLSMVGSETEAHTALREAQAVRKRKRTARKS